MAIGEIPSIYENTTGTITAATGNTVSNSTLVKAGSVVSIFGTITGDYAANSVIATLPSGFIPKNQQNILVHFVLNGNTVTHYLQVLTSGGLRLRYSNTHITSCTFGGAYVL